AVAAERDVLRIPERRAAGLTPAAAGASAGSLEHVKVARVPNLVRVLVDLKRSNVWIYGFEPQATKTYLELDYRAACLLLFGGEGRGLHRLVREASDELARIPLHGPVESLQGAVAAGGGDNAASINKRDSKLETEGAPSPRLSGTLLSRLRNVGWLGQL